MNPLCTLTLNTLTHTPPLVPAGRVPAGNNGLVGIKPSVGRISTTGVVPACYLLDCVSVFALSVGDGAEVARLMENANIAGQWKVAWSVGGLGVVLLARGWRERPADRPTCPPCRPHLPPTRQRKPCQALPAGGALPVCPAWAAGP